METQSDFYKKLSLNHLDRHAHFVKRANELERELETTVDPELFRKIVDLVVNSTAATREFDLYYETDKRSMEASWEERHPKTFLERLFKK